MTRRAPLAPVSLRNVALASDRRVRVAAARWLVALSAAVVAGPSPAATDAGDAADAMKMPHPGMRMAPTTPMEKEMHALQAELAHLKSQMERIGATTDAGEKRRLSAEHLARLRTTLARFYAMELQMVEWVNKGRIVSDSDLRVRQEMLADQSAMLVQMLGQTIQAAEACQ